MREMEWPDKRLDEPFKRLNKIEQVTKQSFAVDEFIPEQYPLLGGVRYSMSQNVNTENNSRSTSKPRQLFNKLGIAFSFFVTTVKNNLEQSAHVPSKPIIQSSEITHVLPNYRAPDTTYFIIPGRIPITCVVFDPAKSHQN
jgi:hypothetical protein